MTGVVAGYHIDKKENKSGSLKNNPVFDCQPVKRLEHLMV